MNHRAKLMEVFQTVDTNKSFYNFDDLCAVIAILLGDNGCPWDLAQTHESLLPCILEECYEVIDAVLGGDNDGLREELGDVLLQAVFHARMAEKDGLFDIGDVVDAVTKKMIARHTHIFGNDHAKDVDEALSTWESNKKVEKGVMSDIESIKRVPRSFPALLRAQKVFTKARKAGLLDCESETREGAIAAARAALDALERGDGDFEIEYVNYLVASLKISSFCKINTELALTNEIQTYINKL